MRRRLLRVVVLACVLSGLLVVPAPAALQTIVQDDATMLYSDPEHLRAATQRLKQLGVDQVRITANWSGLARDPRAKVKPSFDARDPAAYEQARWTTVDNAVRAVRAAGMSVLIDVGFWAPRWATSSHTGSRWRENIRAHDYADFAVAIARRYSGRFVVASAASDQPPPTQDLDPFIKLLMPLLGAPSAPQPAAPSEPLPRVDDFALWNEPNQPGLMLPQWKVGKKIPASPGIYRRMVRAAYPAIKQVRDHTRVLIGNTSSNGGRRGSGPMAPLEFLRELACVNRRLRPRTTRACAHFRRLPGDGWAHHPYTRNETPARGGRGPDDVRIADLPALARTLRRLVRRGRLSAGYRRIYLTEFGFETKHVPGRPTVSQANQARWLTWSEYLADRVPAVRSFAQFLLRDQLPAATIISKSKSRPRGEYSTGLLRFDGKAKIAARTFRAGLFAGLRRGGRRVLLYGRLRLGPGMQAITLQRRVHNAPWTTIARFQCDGQSTFKRTFANRRNAIYRLTFPGPQGAPEPGLPVKPVRARR